MKEQFRRKQITRRSFLNSVGVTAAGLAISACAPSAPAPAAAPTSTAGAAPAGEAAAPAAFDWKMAAGQETSYLGLKAGPEDFWESLVPEFEELTGITVKFEAYEQAQTRQKLATELTAGTSTINTFRTTRGQDFAQYGANGWYEPLDAYMADASMTAPDFDAADFFEGSLNACTLNGQVIALPINTGGQCLMTRKDLLEEKGLKAPTTFDELEQVAKALHNPPDVYGFISRGQKSAAVSMFAAFLHNMGADYLGPDGKTPSLNTPEAIEAYKFYGGLLRDYGPPGIVNMTNVELVPMFSQGQAALFPDDLSYRNQIEDPELSKVVGKVGYANFPAGPARNTPTIYVYGLAISALSASKLASWLWIQFLASKDVALRGMSRGVVASRKSTWEDPRALEGAPEDWVAATQWTFDNGDDGWAPPVVSVPEARDIVGAPIAVAIEGGDVEKACQQANDELAALAKRDGVL